MNTKYHPAFDVVMDCLSSNDSETREELEKYVVHRKLFGRFAAARKFPHCHNIIIHDPMLKKVWDNMLKTIDKL